MDKTTVTPEAEIIAPSDTTTEQKVDETVSDLLPKEDKPTESKVVPEAAFLELKKELKELKKELKETKESERTEVELEGVKELKQKYADVVDPTFIEDLLSAATKEVDSKYSTILQKQEDEKKQLAFDKAFDSLFEKTLNDNPDLPKTIDKDLIKELAITPKYRNVPLSEILIKMYGGTSVGKQSSETEVRGAADRIEDVVSFDKITPDQKKAIMEDSKTRTKYFAWLDTQNG